MEIIVKTIPHKKQRYPTVGDWFFKKDGLIIYVSDLGCWQYESAIAIHEIIEALLCKARGIKEKAVTDFDINFEKEREAGLHKDNEEPGFAPDAPYKKEHKFATKIEKYLINEFDLNWDEYDDKLGKL